MKKYTILLFYGLFPTKVQPNKNCGCGTLYVIVCISKKRKDKKMACGFVIFGQGNGEKEVGERKRV